MCWEATNIHTDVLSMDTDITDLRDAAIALEYHGEEQEAERIKQYVDERAGFRRKLINGLKTTLFYSILIGASVGTIVGFIFTMYDGLYLSAMLILLLGILELIVATFTSKVVQDMENTFEDL